jgi:hypothetical protein
VSFMVGMLVGGLDTAWTCIQAVDRGLASRREAPDAHPETW